MNRIKTQKLYETDGHCHRFEATVLSCDKNSDGNFSLVLDRTAFFPEGGGQSSDEGTINAMPVLALKTAFDETVIIHTVPSAIEVGTVVCGEIDYEARFDKMQNHTAEHICSGIIHELYGFENVGFHLGESEVTMDFDGILSADNLNTVETLANKAVFDNLPINISFYSPNEAENINYRSKKIIDTTLRLVEIGDVDCCACCAPHVSYTGEIGIIKITGFQKYKGGTRVNLLAGKRALNELNTHFKNVKKISNALSSNPHDICDRFAQLQKELHEAKISKNLAKQQYYSLLCESNDYSSGNNITIFERDATVDDMRFLVNLLMTKTDKICSCFSGEDGNYKFIAGSASIDMKIVANQLRTSLNASCGGKNQMIQGSISAAEDEIRRLLDKYI